MRRLKILTTLISLMTIFATVVSQGTTAYYSVRGETVNVITSGDIDIKINEKTNDETGIGDVINIMPGRSVSRIASVENIGNHPCWLRVKINSSTDDKTLPSDIYELDIDNEKWINGFDGYYYYYKILTPESETEDLFTSIKVLASTDNRYIGKTLKVSVKAFAVQSENMNATSPLEVTGWPGEG